MGQAPLGLGLDGRYRGYFAPGALLFATKPLPWKKAEEDCVKRGGHLVSIPDANVNAALRTLAPNNCSHVYWTGAYSLNETGIVWSDGTPQQYVNWAKGHPTNAKKVGMVYDIRTGHWYAEVATSKKSYICKLPAGTKADPTAQAPSCTPSKQMPNCEDDWSYLQSTGKCYKVLNEEGTWDYHDTLCKSLGSRLASIHNEMENAFVRELASTGQKAPVCDRAEWICKASVWIGLWRRDMRGRGIGKFTWSDKTPFNFNAWALNKPRRTRFNTSNEYSYVSIYPDPVATPKPWGPLFAGKWDHLGPNWASRASVCKRDY